MPDSSVPQPLLSAPLLKVQRDRFQRDFRECRAVTLTQFADLDNVIMSSQAHPDFSPVGWHLGHIGYTESLWLLEHCGGFPCPFPQYSTLLAADGLPKAQRQHLPPLPEFLHYLQTIRTQTLNYLESAPLDQQERLWHFILQHESQHGETIAIVLALLNHHSPTPPLHHSPTPTPPNAHMVHVPAGAFLMGYGGADALDNERPAHPVYLDDYWIDAYPVTCGEFAQFISAGGYEDPQWWTEEGWQWRCSQMATKTSTQPPITQAPITHPLYWPYISPPQHPTPNLQPPILDTLPVCGVSWYEADAYARFAGKRLPSEAEWEKAARWDPTTGACTHYPWGNEIPTSDHANHQHSRGHLSPVNAYPEGQSAVGCWDLLGNVWEWTADWFTPYEGFSPYPYQGYSQTYFDQQHRVLRGGSWATRRWGLRSSFRNWYHPHVRQIFAGLRCAKS